MEKGLELKQLGFKRLPKEIIGKITTYLEVWEILNIRSVAKRMDEVIWSSPYSVLRTGYPQKDRIVIKFKVTDRQSAEKKSFTKKCCEFFLPKYKLVTGKKPKYFFMGKSILRLKLPLNDFDYKINDDDIETFCNFLKAKNFKIYGLDIHDSDITDKGLRYLQDIEYLDLRGCFGITDKGLEYLKKVKYLKLKYLFTDKGLEYLKNVEDLTLTDCKDVTDEGLKHLANAKRLNLCQCHKITDKGLKYLQNAEYLNVGLCSRITDDGLRYLKNVKDLDLLMCNVTDEGLQYLKNVESLVLQGCSRITDAGLKCLKSVKYLNLTDCKITDKGLENLITNATNLTRLDIDKCVKITDKGIAYLKNLQRLSIRGCKKITDNGLTSIITNNPDLEYLDLTSCPKITNIGRMQLEKLKKLTKIEITNPSNSGGTYLKLEGRQEIQEYLNKLKSELEKNKAKEGGVEESREHGQIMQM